MFRVSDNSDDVLTSVQQSARSGRQQVTMSRHQSAETCSNRSSCKIRSSRSKASIGKLLEMPKKTLRYIVSGYDTILKSTFGKYRQGERIQFRPRIHHHSRH